MAQIKKEEIHKAILKAAFKLFSREGYVKTTLPMIAREAGVSTPNIYSYFPSKLTLLYELHDPWLRGQFAALSDRLDAMDPDPAARITCLLQFLWKELPALQKGFANNAIQAMATSTPKDEYRTDTIDWMESEIERMLVAALPPERRPIVQGTEMAHMLVMAMDGYIMYRHTRPQRPCSAETISTTVAMLLGQGAPDKKAQRSS